jgi:uncharacterized secreted protein with C-terminal beta-propeller domain
MRSYKIVFVILVLLLIVFSVGGIIAVLFSGYNWDINGGSGFIFSNKKQEIDQNIEKPDYVKKANRFIISKFSSKEELISYLQSSENNSLLGVGIGKGGEVMVPAVDSLTKDLSFQSFQSQTRETSVLPSRFSYTNVQVEGIDEPDVLKTDGNYIYYSSYSPQYFVPMREVFIKPVTIKQNTKIINAFPLENLSLLKEIKEGGKLLLSKDKDILAIFSDRSIFGFDVKDKNNPQKKWELELNDRFYLLDSRLKDDKLYILLRGEVNKFSPCPVNVFKNNTSINCNDIYYSKNYIDGPDSIFVVLSVDFLNGEVQNKISFLASSYSSVFYMSPENIYVTYKITPDYVKFTYDFLSQKAQDLIPSFYLEKIRKIKDYDISFYSKANEVSYIINSYFSSLERDEELRVQTELENRMRDYYKGKIREIDSTAVLKIDRKDFKIVSVGEIPGAILNQFSLDEYNGKLRVAVSVGDNFWVFGNITSGALNNSVNDVYILDDKLNIISSIKDLGLGERIYSVRFIENKGYVVTFRQIDPFYVLDLSDPYAPFLGGELKIPGYSSYLHPIDKNKILGVGQEGWSVKISLFDVSDIKNPKEIDKYILKEGWSLISETHHAFLMDKENEIFFIPAGSSAYIFSYKNSKLNLIKVVTGTNVQRALYIDQYLYIIGDDRIIVLDEKSWEKIKELKFE